MANGRLWTGREVFLLMQCAEGTAYEDAAKLIGRSVQSVQTKARLMGIKWNSGGINLNQIAKELGCSIATVKRMHGILFADNKGRREGKSQNGFKNGNRYQLTDEQAERLRRVLKQTLSRREAHRIAGRKRFKKSNQKEIGNG